MSLGGVLGGLFNALVAPLVFRSIVEHEAALVAACLLLPALKTIGPLYIQRRLALAPSRVRGWCVDLAVAVLVGVFTFDLLLFYASQGADTIPPTTTLFALIQSGLSGMARVGNQGVVYSWKILLYGLPILVCLAFRNRPLRFGLALAAFVCASRLHGPLPDFGRSISRVIYRDRSFFGVLKVEVEAEDTFWESHVLMHGTTLHGRQFKEPRLATSLSPTTRERGRLARSCASSMHPKPPRRLR